MNGKEKYTTDIELLKKEIEISFFKSSGPGGQRKNKRETAVKIFHPPSGLTVIATEHRLQAKNRELALKRLQEKLEELNREKKPRIPTKAPERMKEKVLEEKKKQAEKKKLRKRPIITTEDEEE
jgi:protein subunit release factor B